jgi:hypothetical protein
VSDEGRIITWEGFAAKVNVSVRKNAASVWAVTRKVKIKYSTRYRQASRTHIQLASFFCESIFRGKCSKA